MSNLLRTLYCYRLPDQVLERIIVRCLAVRKCILGAEYDLLRFFRFYELRCGLG